METTATQIEAMDHLESLWNALDQLFDSFDSETWQRSHGPDWTFADLPYHLAYFDRDLIGKSIEAGSNVPPEGQVTFNTLRELGGWNARMFSLRPEDQTTEQSIEAMRSAREYLRDLVSNMDEDALKSPAFIPLPGAGWLTVADVLENCRGHTWVHLQEALIRLKRSGPLPSVEASKASLAMYLGFLPRFMDKEAAAALGKPFSAQVSVHGHGGGDWAINVNQGASGIEEGRSDNADLTLTFRDPSVFASMLLGIKNPTVLVMSRAIKVKGLRHMPTFGKLFPTPGPDTRLGGG